MVGIPPTPAATRQHPPVGKGGRVSGSVCAVDSWHFRIAQIGNALDARKNTGDRAPISTADMAVFWRWLPSQTGKSMLEWSAFIC